MRSDEIIRLDDELMTVDEVAKFIHTNKSKVYSLVNAGILPCIRLGRLKILKSSLLSMLVRYENCDISDPSNITYMDKGFKAAQ